MRHNGALPQYVRDMVSRAKVYKGVGGMRRLRRMPSC